MVTDKSAAHATEGYTELGEDIYRMARRKGWSLAKLAKLAGITETKLHRILRGASIQYRDGLILEELLGFGRGALDNSYRLWTDRKGREL